MHGTGTVIEQWLRPARLHTQSHDPARLTCKKSPAACQTESRFSSHRARAWRTLRVDWGALQHVGLPRRQARYALVLVDAHSRMLYLKSPIARDLKLSPAATSTPSLLWAMSPEKAH
jgi:hypothetical protein